MNVRKGIILLVLIAISWSFVSSSSFFHTKAQASVPSFPGAEGFGAASIGGRGGKVYEVTNTNDDGDGSLRYCVNDTKGYGARTCVFRVGGTITVKTPLSISKPYITIAGQTAPGGGITIRTESGGDVFATKTHDVIMRYVTARPGPGGENHANQIASNGTELYNVMIDHSTFSWGVDSNIETWYRVKNATIQWSLISEGLNCSTHSKGCHSKGLMIGGYKGSESGGVGSENISVLYNIMANNADRNPLMQQCGIAQVINNVTYNPNMTYSHQQLNCPLGESYVNWINNYHKKGTNGTQTDLKIIPSDDGECMAGKTYMSGNVGNNGTWTYSFSGACDAKKTTILQTSPAAAPSVTTVSAADAYAQTVADGGAGNSKGLSCDGTWFTRRDSIDSRVIADVKNGTGKIIDSPSDVGGYVTISSGVACPDADHDGMPDTWESSHGFNPSDASDGPKDANGNGYTNLEEYLNGSGSTILVNPTATPVSVTTTVAPSSTPKPSATPLPTATPTPTRKVGDANNDGAVNESDYSIWKTNYQKTVTNGMDSGDFNKDDVVDGVDYMLFVNNYGK